MNEHSKVPTPNELSRSNLNDINVCQRGPIGVEVQCSFKSSYSMTFEWRCVGNTVHYTITPRSIFFVPDIGDHFQQSRKVRFSNYRDLICFDCNSNIVHWSGQSAAEVMSIRNSVSERSKECAQNKRSRDRQKVRESK